MDPHGSAIEGPALKRPRWRPSRRLRRVLTAVVVVLALVGFGYAVVDAWRDTGGELPAASRLLAAGGVWLLGLAAASYGWAGLLGGSRWRHAAALIVSQVGKYVPGGVLQASGQVALARSSGITVRKAATAFWVHAMMQGLAGGAFLLVLVLLWGDASWSLRILGAFAGLASLLLVDRRWMVWVLRKVPRARDEATGLVPDQAAVVMAWVSSVFSLGSVSTAYVILLGSFGEVDRALFVLAGYAVAWTVGFLAVPIPSGLGVREAALAAILAGHTTPSVLVATSVYLRLVMIVTEGIAALALTPWLRPRASRGADQDPPR